MLLCLHTCHFEPQVITYANPSPTDSFSKLIEHDVDDVSTLSAKEFDPKGQYDAVLKAVEKAADGAKTHIFQIELGGARGEYWIVAVHEGKVVGVRAKAVES